MVKINLNEISKISKKCKKNDKPSLYACTVCIEYIKRMNFCWETLFSWKCKKFEKIIWRNDENFNKI